MDESPREEAQEAPLQSPPRRSWRGRFGRVLLGLLLLGVVGLFTLEYALLTGAVDVPMQYLREATPTPETSVAGAANSGQREPVVVDPELIRQAPSKGDPDAPVVMVEFSDFQCGFCKGWTTEVAPDLQPYIDRGELRLVLLDVIGPSHLYAETAARAAHCARGTGGDAAYWTMHDALFATMNEWGEVEEEALDGALGEVASGAGLDGDAVTACLEQGLHGDRVAAGMEEAMRIGVMGTPTFLINGAVVYGLQPLESYQQVIDQALQEQR